MAQEVENLRIDSDLEKAVKVKPGRNNVNMTEEVENPRIDGDIEKAVKVKLGSETGEDHKGVSDELYGHLYSWLCGTIQQERNHWKRKMESTLQELNRQHKVHLTCQTTLEKLLAKFDGTYGKSDADGITETPSTEELLRVLEAKLDAILNVPVNNQTKPVASSDGPRSSVPQQRKGIPQTEVTSDGRSSQGLDDFPSEGVPTSPLTSSQRFSTINHDPNVDAKAEIDGQEEDEEMANKLECDHSSDIIPQQPLLNNDYQDSDDSVLNENLSHTDPGLEKFDDGNDDSRTHSNRAMDLESDQVLSEVHTHELCETETLRAPDYEGQGNQTTQGSHQDIRPQVGAGQILPEIKSPQPESTRRVVPISNCQVWASGPQANKPTTHNSYLKRSPVQQPKETFSVKRLAALSYDQRHKYEKVILSKKQEITYLKSDLQEAMDQIQKLQKVIQRLYILNRHLRDTPTGAKDTPRAEKATPTLAKDTPKTNKDTPRTTKDIPRQGKNSSLNEQKDGQDLRKADKNLVSRSMPSLNNIPLFQAMPGAEMALWKLRVKHKSAQLGKKIEVVQCFRCQGLFRPSENNNISCRYHRNGQKAVEKYDKKGKLVRVVYKWACCQRDVDAPGCTHSQHI